MYWLAIEREAVSLIDLRENLVFPVSIKTLLEVIDSLERRSMIEVRTDGRFTLQAAIMEYVTDEFVEQAYDEINRETFKLLVSHSLIKAQAKDYVRESQIHFILTPVSDRLLLAFGKEGTQSKLKSIIAKAHQTNLKLSGYTAGNILNLLVHLKTDLLDTDFSHLTVWQAYLQGVHLPGVNFAFADLAKSIFNSTFGSSLSVTFNPDGELLAAGMATREIWLWQTFTGTPLHTYYGHKDWVWSVAFSPDGKLLASGSEDQTIRIWEVSTGQCLNVLQGLSHWMYSVTFSPDGNTLATCGEEGVVELWDIQAGMHTKTLRSDRPYERMNITNVRGLTKVQKSTLIILGAFEDL